MVAMSGASAMQMMQLAVGNAVGVLARLVPRGVDPLGPSDIDPDDIRDRACSVTVPSRLCSPEAPKPPSDRPPPDLPDPGFAVTLANTVVLLLVIALAAGLVWLAMKYFRSPRLDRDDDDDAASDVDEAIDEAVDERIVDHETPPDRWRRRAAEYRDRGDFRESVRCEYRALVGDLARAGHVDEIPGRTSGEERDQVRELAPGLGERGRNVAAQFDVAADTFDSAWFDDAEVIRADDERFVAASREVLDVMLSGARRAVGRRS